MKVEFKKRDKKIHKLDAACDKSLLESMRLIEKIDSIDWSVVERAEATLANTLAEFQVNVDALLESITKDMKRWKNQNADLIAKHEIDQTLTKALYSLCLLLK